MLSSMVSTRVTATVFFLASLASPGHANSLRPAALHKALEANSTSLLEVEAEFRIFEPKMRYMPSHNLVVCACAKCGSSSLYDFIYEKEFGKHWPYHGAPFAQTTDSDRWEGRFLKVDDLDEQAEIMKKAFSFALVRDPVDRLISAWKSKVACDSNKTGVDKTDRARMVPALLRLIGDERSDAADCLSFDDFTKALHTAHRAGRAGELNVHWLPQDRACFGRFPAEQWSKVVAITSPDSFNDLARRLKDEDESEEEWEQPPRAHASKWNKQASELAISPRTASLLASITANEYQMLSQHLPRL